jgi:hypothetical protein
MTAARWIGLDFGTTNSAVALADACRAVRQIFFDRFGEEKMTGGEELTSVATGLALRAREEWSDG